MYILLVIIDMRFTFDVKIVLFFSHMPIEILTRIYVWLFSMPRLLKWMVLSWWSQDFRRVFCVQFGILDWVNCSSLKSGNFAYSVQKPG